MTRDRQPDRHGGTAIETAIVLPLILLFIFGLTEFGRALWMKTTLDYAVEAAARCAVVDANTCPTVAQTQAYAASKALGLALAPASFTVSLQPCGQRVAASVQFQSAVPGLLPWPITLDASACYPK